MMKIAFLISAYTDPQHLKRFINSLPEGSHFFIHVDKGVDEEPFRRLITHPNVHFIDKRVRVMWGSFTQVQFQMELIRAALGFGKAFDYLFMLSAQDYPVWSNRRIIAHLEANKGKNYLMGMCLVGRPHAETFEYTRYRFLNNYPWKYGTLKSKCRVALRKILAPFLKKPIEFTADGRHYRLYKGSDYFALTGELAAYVLKTYDESPQLRGYFKSGFAPSETFTHTVAFNSPFADTCILYMPLQKENGIRLETLTPLTYIEYGAKIKELTEDDYSAIIQSDKMFCRKCVTGISDTLLSLIDAQREL